MAESIWFTSCQCLPVVYQFSTRVSCCWQPNRPISKKMQIMNVACSFIPCKDSKQSGKKRREMVLSVKKSFYVRACCLISSEMNGFRLFFVSAFFRGFVCLSTSHLLPLPRIFTERRSISNILRRVVCGMSIGSSNLIK